MVLRCGNDPIFEGVAFLQAEDADGFDAYVLVSGEFFYGGIGSVGDGTGQKFGSAAVGVADAHQRNLYLLEGAVVIEGYAGKLASTQDVVDFDDGVNFFAGVAVGFKADMGFEQLNLEGKLRAFRGFFGRSAGCRLLLGVVGGLLFRLLREERAGDEQEQESEETKAQFSARRCHVGSLGGAANSVKRRMRGAFRVRHGAETRV